MPCTKITPASAAPRVLTRGSSLGSVVVGMLAVVAAHSQTQQPAVVLFDTLYAEHCSVCHGANLEGAAQGTPLAGVELKHGDSPDALAQSISAGIPGTTMPAWSQTLDANQIRQLAIYIAEQRSELTYTDFKVATPPALPLGNIASELHGFRVEIVATGLDPLTFSIAPLTDGSILVTEKQHGIRVVSPEGIVSDLVQGTPQGYEDGFQVPEFLLTYGLGWFLDVAPHPDHAQNGWIYLHYGDRCSDCNEAARTSGRPVSMNKLIRGRINDGHWVDEQVIWSADIETYTMMPDMTAGGRIAFDDAGHVYLSVGIKGPAEHVGVQDLSLPYGKIHRVNDDGSIPADNPFVGRDDALPSVWTYGHRSPQGLEFDPATGRLWQTEMGQRGGDEVNLLQPGRNYGWPLVSLGMQYTGAPVAFGNDLGISFDPADLVPPVVDLTPSPAVSSFVVYTGAAFPRWEGNLIVGTLKATELYRMVVGNDGQITQRELLLKDLGRIRDVETGTDGLLYLLIEHASGSKIVRLVPERG
jgi:aldose sugar dehydrogenase